MQGIVKYLAYEIAILGAGGQGNQQRFSFVTNNYLTGRQIVGLEVYTNQDCDYSPVSTANTLWTPANAKDCYLTLRMEDTAPGTVIAQGAKTKQMANWVENIPMVSLHRSFGPTAMPAVFELLTLNKPIIDWGQSYINFSQAQAIATNVSALFGVYYL